MQWSQRFFALGLALALSAGVSCTAGDGPMGVPEAQPIEQPSQSLGSVLDGLGGVVGGLGEAVDGVVDLAGGVIGGVLDLTGLLKCEEQKYDVAYKTIGPKGGTITVGKHVLVIPKGALRQNVRIKAEQMRGPTNSVRFSPEGLEFEKQAILALNYKNCQNIEAPKAVVYTTERLEILEVQPSRDYRKYRYVTGEIDHFSRYAVAY